MQNRYSGCETPSPGSRIGKADSQARPKAFLGQWEKPEVRGREACSASGRCGCSCAHPQRWHLRKGSSSFTTTCTKRRPCLFLPHLSATPPSVNLHPCLRHVAHFPHREWEPPREAAQTGRHLEYPPSLWDGSWQCADSSTRCTSDVGASKHPVPDGEGLLLRKNGGLPSLQQPECPLGTDFRQPCSS